MQKLTALRFKPRINPELDYLLGNGALAHMIEFKIGLDEEYLLNLVNAISGEFTGSHTDYRQKLLLFNEDKNIFPALPTSSIKKGFPFNFYLEKSNIGFLIDPNNVQFCFIHGNDAISVPLLDQNFVAFSTKLPEVLTKINTITTEGVFYKSPVFRSDEENKMMKDFFYGEFFKLYSQGAKRNSPDFFNNFASAKNFGMDIMPEICVTAPPSSIKAILVVGNQNSKYPDDYSIERTGSFTYIGAAVNAFVLQKLVKDKAGINLPTIHYNYQGENKSPIIREVIIEPSKIRQALKNGDLKEYATKVFGEKYVTDFMLGRTATHFQRT